MNSKITKYERTDKYRELHWPLHLVVTTLRDLQNLIFIKDDFIDQYYLTQVTITHWLQAQEKHDHWRKHPHSQSAQGTATLCNKQEIRLVSLQGAFTVTYMHN